VTELPPVNKDKIRTSFSKLNDKTINKIRISGNGSVVIQTEDVGFVIKAEPPHIYLESYDKANFEKIVGHAILRASAKPLSVDPKYLFHKIHTRTSIVFEFHSAYASDWDCRFYDYGTEGTERTTPSLFMFNSGLNNIIALPDSGFELGLDSALNGVRAFDFNKLFQAELF